MRQETAAKQSTRQRLIEAAGQLFAEKGFKETTVREISEQAGANLAAVNYHFRDKEGLYEEIILYILNGIKEEFPVDKDIDETPSPEARLRTFIRNMVYRFNDPARPAWQGTLLAQERMNPRPIILTVIHEEIGKTISLLSSIMLDLLDPDSEPEDIKLCMDSVMGQLLFQAHARGPHAPPMVQREVLQAKEIDRLIQHIAEFSLAGIRQIRKRNQDNKDEKQ